MQNLNAVRALEVRVSVDAQLQDGPEYVVVDEVTEEPYVCEDDSDVAAVALDVTLLAHVPLHLLADAEQMNLHREADEEADDCVDEEAGRILAPGLQ